MPIEKIETYGVKYIGSKNTINAYILDLVEKECKGVKTVIDVFTGTTRVAQAFKRKGYRVTTSDLSWASTAYAYTFIHNRDNKHLQKYIDELNALTPKAGWITENYCDVAPKNAEGKNVRVWQAKNGQKADAIREYIDDISLSHWEKYTLITSLIFALDVVDNTVGVQQAYLKDWCIRSYKDLKLKLPPMIEGKTGTHELGDCLEINYPNADLAYLDPPYSPHSYATYYHIWDSIALWDKPDVGLKTNRRVDRVAKHKDYDKHFESPWNRKNSALQAFSDLIDRLPCRYILISYSDDSIINKDDLIDKCNEKGKVIIEYIDYKRNIMHKIGNMTKETEVIGKNKELLILLEKK